MKPKNFFLVITPGLEKLALKELKEKLALLSALHKVDLPFEVLGSFKGGIEIKCDEALGLALNHWLKIPTRILLRLVEFRARDFPKLFNRARKLPWHNYLRQGEVLYSVSVHESRLKMKESIAAVIKDALQDCVKHQPFRKAFLDVPQTLFVRVKQDTVVISIDTSGEPLHKRGLKVNSVEAPMRETLAAALVYPVLSVCSGGVLVDMMAGSGTIGFEVLSFYLPVRTRKFSYQNFPGVVGVEELVGKKALRENQVAINAYEVDQQAYLALGRNIEALKSVFDSNLNPFLGDVFLASHDAGLHFICNPPYDLRLKTDLLELLKRFALFASQTSAASFSLVWPGDKAPDIGLPWRSSTATSNGGIPVTLNFWTKNNI